MVGREGGPLRDDNVGDQLTVFFDEPVDVVCPSCAAHAVVVRLGDGVKRRLVCPACAHVREHPGRRLTIHDDGRDPWFGQPLWLRSTTSWGPVWAYHQTHRAQLRAFIAADLRQRRHQGRGPGWKGKLPVWMTMAIHRQAILRAIDSMPDPTG